MAQERPDSDKSTIALFGMLVATETTASKIKDLIASTNEAFKAAYGPPQPRTGVINPAKLARQIHYYSLIILETDETQEGTHARPRWTACARAYEDFCKRNSCLALGLPAEVSDEDLSALLTTNRLGNRTPKIYSALALFVVDLHERGRMSSNFMRFALPSSELSYLDELRDYLRAAAHSIAEGSDTPSATAEDTSEISVHFYVNISKMKELEGFHGHFREEEDSCSHFICYRPRMGDPRELMKTFIAIKPPQAKKPDTLPTSNAFNFVHIYSPPGTDSKNRISMGRVLPLDEGLYFVGGQRHKTERKTPFKTLKVIALPWIAVNRGDAVLPALVMSANNDMRHIVSRATIRATPISHSESIKLGSVKLTELAADLAADCEQELKILSDSNASDDTFKKYGLSKDAEVVGAAAPRFLEDLLKFTNNSPTKWDLIARYDRKGSSKEPGAQALTRTSIERELERIFGSDSDGKFWNATDGFFDFWASIRFGPLSRRS